VDTNLSERRGSGGRRHSRGAHSSRRRIARGDEGHASSGIRRKALEGDNREAGNKGLVPLERACYGLGYFQCLRGQPRAAVWGEETLIFVALEPHEADSFTWSLRRNREGAVGVVDSRSVQGEMVPADENEIKPAFILGEALKREVKPEQVLGLLEGLSRGDLVGLLIDILGLSSNRVNLVIKLRRGKAHLQKAIILSVHFREREDAVASIPMAVGL
jgi:hypothetical protein